ncbi:CidA/LrgA family protein [Salinicoccus kekensis]|uniref:Holin-like protein n=1 Tax=Salinicoccus kekensis TaxID=714307 RepID=A0A285UT03_9STAP|nr:CidA/LrgA family holin-like protein [Salinicoccus kekensis]SOC44518.1 holin-like protein [Salinicoccus kekensis]
MVKSMKIVLQIAILYILYQAGEWLSETFQLALPGSVIGMMLLILLLFTRVIRIEWIGDGAGFMVKYLPFFFIPSTLGIMQYYGIFQGKGFMLVIIVLVSTILVMAVSGLIGHLSGGREGQP